MFDLATTVLGEPGTGNIWAPIAGELLDACGGDFLVLMDQDAGPTAGRRDTLRLRTAGGFVELRLDADVLDRIHHGCPLIAHYRATRDRTPRTAAEVVGERSWRGGETARLLRAALGTEHVLGLPLPDRSRPVRGFTIHRSGPGFTAAQRTYARRIQLLLSGVDKHADLLRSWRRPIVELSGTGDTGGTERPSGPDALGLTPRETAVLILLADALTAAAIGRRLGISVRTAQKHIQSIYRKLGTRDRVATVLRAQNRGLIPTEAECS
ncbi:helix-turn-helix transcriptional regulator [Streptomyces silvensis]|uniref:HTH luxR-type domain-containing protein n=1 Tax=Streptomyces silvensis TaxID=1765722 RepID=A0A0W7WV29_9ACTN|nr:LuxR C-terminal-related transcriptional regulator [Streptomyces silvensis]KUF14442.1 hypothetical protein AT728_31720 [Streptomyces silvensis]